ncbi:hypothetical protein, partial [Lacibacter sp.]|uniref:hypothetical protein n=1 Tax=Lacibacter sp. TaxID=1915409 RepID=UPI002B4B5070
MQERHKEEEGMSKIQLPKSKRKGTRDKDQGTRRNVQNPVYKKQEKGTRRKDQGTRMNKNQTPKNKFQGRIGMPYLEHAD